HDAYGNVLSLVFFFFFSSRRRHTRSKRDWSSDVCSSDLGHSVSSFYLQFQSALDSLGVDGSIPDATPFDLSDADRPFVEDHEHATYVPEHANRYWRILSQVNLVLEEFAAGYSGKTSPVHHVWHTFDIAVTRFSTRPVSQLKEHGELICEASSR